jgi:hypothetical protein
MYCCYIQRDTKYYLAYLSFERVKKWFALATSALATMATVL